MDNADNNVLEGALESMAYAESSVIFDLVHTLQSFLQISRPITGTYILYLIDIASPLRFRH